MFVHAQNESPVVHTHTIPVTVNNTHFLFKIQQSASLITHTEAYSNDIAFLQFQLSLYLDLKIHNTSFQISNLNHPIRIFCLPCTHNFSSINTSISINLDNWPSRRGAPEGAREYLIPNYGAIYSSCQRWGDWRIEQ